MSGGEWGARRFWKDVTVAAQGGGYGILLDGREVRTPAKAPLVVPTRALAEALAQEWRAQDKRVDPAVMPFTRSANAAIDKVRPRRDEVVAHLAEYGDSDLLCYRAEAPQELCARQAAEWDPLLDWCAHQFGATLQPVAGVMHRPQDPGALARLETEVAAMDTFQLTAFHDLVALSGSLVLGLAAIRNLRPIEELWQLSRLDELWQEEHWGEDDEAQALAETKRAAFLHAKTFYDMAV